MRLTILLAVAWIAAAVPAAASEFSTCVADLRDAAVGAGVSPSLAAEALDVPEPDEAVLRVSKVQPEFKTPIWDYLGFLVDDQRVEDGRAKMQEHDDVLKAAERRYGVDRHVIAAVWGVETDYGRKTGANFLPHALATLACRGERRADNCWRR